MLTTRIIPCLDVKNGRTVKGRNFEGLRDAGDPIEQAQFYAKNGADEVCFLDITASNENRSTIFDVVEKTAKKCMVPFTVGGGIKSVSDVRKLLNLGADKVSINSFAVKNPEVISQIATTIGSQSLVVAIDVKEVNGKYEVFVKGGREPTGIEALSWAKEVEKRGAGEILLTSMDKDGTKSGYDLEILEKISSSVKVPVIASG
jgi:cyclase